VGTRCSGGAGALHSTVSDLLKFLEALDSEISPFSAAVRILNAPRGAGLGMLKTTEGRGLIEHTGLTSGYHAYVGYVPQWKRGAVVLANADIGPVADLGLHLIDARCALHWYHEEAVIDTASFDNLTGSYRVRPSLIIAVTREGDRLYGQATDSPRRRLFPVSNRHYFCKSIDAEIAFEPQTGRAERLILHQSGMRRIAERLP
jgi:hypothetical protein